MTAPLAPDDHAVRDRPPRDPVQRWRLVLARDASAREQAQRIPQAAWEAFLPASGLPVAGLDATRPKARFVLAAPLPALASGEREMLDLWLTERLPRWLVRERLVAGLPATDRLIDLFDVWLGEPSLPGQVSASVYRADLDPAAGDPAALRETAASLLGAETLPRERRKGAGAVVYDLRPFIEAIEVVVSRHDDRSAGDPVAPQLAIRMTLLHDPERGVGRPDEVLAVIEERLGALLRPMAIVRERLMLSPPAAPEPPPARSVRPSPGRPARR